MLEKDAVALVKGFSENVLRVGPVMLQQAGQPETPRNSNCVRVRLAKEGPPSLVLQ